MVCVVEGGHIFPDTRTRTHIYIHIYIYIPTSHYIFDILTEYFTCLRAYFCDTGWSLFYVLEVGRYIKVDKHIHDLLCPTDVVTNHTPPLNPARKG